MPLCTVCVLVYCSGLQYAALKIAETHHLLIETIGAVDPQCCGPAWYSVNRCIDSALYRRRLVTRCSIVFPTVDVMDIGL